MEVEMKRLLLIVLVVALAVSSLSANGGKETTASAKPQTLSLAIWGNDARKTKFEELGAVYTERTGIKVEIILIPFGEFMQKISIQMAAGNAPDVIWLAEKMVPQFRDSGQLVDLAPSLQSDSAYDFKDIFPTTLDLYRSGNKIYGVPFAFGPRVYFFNETMFREKGLKTPLELAAEGNWTLDTMYESAKKLTDKSKGIYGIKLFGATAPKDWANALYDIVWAIGADFFSEDMSKFELNSPEGIKAIQYYYDMLYKDEIHTKPGDQTQFESGKIGITRDTFSYSANLRKITDFEWDIAPNPTGPNADAKIASGFANYSVTKGSGNEEAAIDLLKYFTSKEVMMDLVSTFPSPRRSVLTSPEFLNQPDGKPSPSSVTAAFVNPIEKPGVRSLPAHGNYQKIDVQMQTYFDMLYAHSVTVKEMVAQMQNVIQPLLDE
jgi:multiple sugar transport system substrate-binding protein